MWEVFELEWMKEKEREREREISESRRRRKETASKRANKENGRQKSKAEMLWKQF